MSKILLVSDVHIGSYSTRNPSAEYRLYQGSRIVSENIIKVGKEKGCKYIAFAGDVIEKSVLRPYVLAEVKYFLDRVMSEFEGGWLVYGNHCLDCKSSDQDMKDSLLGVILPSNLKYAHQTIDVVDGMTIGFSNFQPIFDLSWIPNKVDALITHATICYSPSDFIKSQELDESKFDIAFCGDIHRKASLGKYVSIGIPQKCKMGDSDEATGIVLDCSSKSWEWVDLNPDNNLMKFVYTDNITEHGWDESTGTWREFKPTLNKAGNQVVNVQTAADKVEELFNQYIQANSLMEVHQEVMQQVKDIDAGCIDFDFTLTKFYCKNWRSIEEVTMYFDHGDKVLIIGENGAGKSSLTSAIKYAFADTRDTNGLTSLKPFIQFGTKDCMTEVEFVYQGNNYRLRRGTKEYGLWINDEQQKYSDKKSFEADARARFPFTQYIDVFFLDADHNQLIGGMSAEKKSLIVSKFFKLDKIDTLHDTAVFMLKQFDKDRAVWGNRIDKAEEVLRFINQKLSEIQLPSVSKADLENSRREGLEIQRRSNEWNNFVTRSASLTATIKATEDRLQELSNTMLNFRLDSVIDQEISAAMNTIRETQQKITELGSIKLRVDSKAKEIEDLKAEGNRAWRESQSIGIGKVCTSCGQEIKTPEAVMNHKRELDQKVLDLKAKKAVLDTELSQLQQEWSNVQLIYSELDRTIQEQNSLVSSRMMEKKHQEQISQEYNQVMGRVNSLKNELSLMVKPAEVYLPDNFMMIMSQLESQISAWTSYENYMQDLGARQLELEECKKAVEGILVKSEGLQKYINMTGPTGEIYYEILTKLATQFSDTTVNYVVKKYSNRGDHLNLESQFNNNGNWVDYAACSSGQKTVLDIHFLQKIVTRLGILVMDEFLKHLDPGNHDKCIDMISEMCIGCIMLSSHMESVAAFNNKTCKLSLNKSCMSEIEFI